MPGDGSLDSAFQQRSNSTSSLGLHAYNEKEVLIFQEPNHIPTGSLPAWSCSGRGSLSCLHELQMTFRRESTAAPKRETNSLQGEQPFAPRMGDNVCCNSRKQFPLFWRMAFNREHTTMPKESNYLLKAVRQEMFAMQTNGDPWEGKKTLVDAGEKARSGLVFF